jgi:hypothetical protein
MHRKVPVRFGPEVAGKGPAPRAPRRRPTGVQVWTIRSPGEKPWTRKTEIFEYRTFYGVLQEMARDLRRRGVTHVVMEARGIYTDPVYYALCEQDFDEVAVVNPAHVKALRGHKTDPRRTAAGWPSCSSAGCCAARISRRRS